MTNACEGCSHELIPGVRFATRADGHRAIERCDACGRYETDDQAFERVEWFLSGAIIEAYAAHDDLTQAYPIARLVVARWRSPGAAKIAACARQPREEHGR